METHLKVSFANLCIGFLCTQKKKKYKKTSEKKNKIRNIYMRIYNVRWCVCFCAWPSTASIWNSGLCVRIRQMFAQGGVYIHIYIIFCYIHMYVRGMYLATYGSVGGINNTYKSVHGLRVFFSAQISYQSPNKGAGIPKSSIHVASEY